jgi:dipeptidyl aminopeptidase/acylaminoacyl peptidase
VASAKAAIDKAVEMGVTDPQRVGVGGHSYGAFMTANLLAHSDLFRAGVARSGAYNRTLTPFGFQSERMYQAIKGNGEIVRYVQLPYEAHGYLPRESTEHTLWEMVTWFDKWVKNAPPAGEQTRTASGSAQH